MLKHKVYLPHGMERQLVLLKSIREKIVNFKEKYNKKENFAPPRCLIIY